MSLLFGAFFVAVVGVSDGDTMTVLYEREPIKIRLAEIDAPEKSQPFGMKAKQALSDLCYGKRAEVTPKATDRYGRIVARVRCDSTDASEHLVRAGMAWVFYHYVTDKFLYPLQIEAQRTQIGIWADDNPVPPWEWRKTH